VLEKWMTPSILEDLNAVDETTYCAELSALAESRLKNHWQTFELCGGTTSCAAGCNSKMALATGSPISPIGNECVNWHIDFDQQIWHRVGSPVSGVVSSKVNEAPTHFGGTVDVEANKCKSQPSVLYNNKIAILAVVLLLRN
jgi:hypothetical protein